MEIILHTIFNSAKKLFNAWLFCIKQIPWILAKDAFLFMVLFILLDIAFGEFLLYQYGFLLEIEETEIASVPVKFQEDTYQSVIKEWQVRENTFNHLTKEVYSDPFQ